MRALELLLIVAVLLTLATRLLHPTRAWRPTAFLPSAAVCTALLHVVFEGYRWQMIPAYVLAAVVFAATSPGLRGRQFGPAPSRKRRILRTPALAAGFAALVAAAVVPGSFPVFQLPEPSGPYPVGTTWDAFAARAPAAVRASSGRVVSLQFWYPAEARPRTRPISYMSREAARAVTSAWRLPPYLLDHFALVRTHSYRDAPAAHREGGFPVVLLALSGLMTGCTALAEGLASHGYVVVAVGHGDPGWSPFVFDKNGMVVALDTDDGRSNELRRELDSASVEQVKSNILRARSPHEKRALLLELNRRQPLNVADVELCGTEISSVIDRLEATNRSGFFANRLDLGRVAAVGFSKGGAVAGQVCLKEARVKAGVNMDGFMYGEIVHAPLARPFLFLHSENPDFPEAYINDWFFESAKSSAYLVKFKGTRHASFGDMPLWGFFVRNTVGPMDGRRCVRMLEAYLRAFLDKHLKGMQAPLLAGRSPEYPEVEILTRLPQEHGEQ